MPKPSLRDALVDAAFNELHAKGYAATGVAAIAAAANAPKGSFYNHFASKEALAVEVLGRYGQSRRLEMLSDSADSPLQRIHNHVDYLRQDLAAHDYRRGCMFGNFAAEGPVDAATVTDAVAASLEQWRRTMADAIGEARDAGEIAHEVDPDAAAQFIVDAWEGAALRAKTAGDSTPIDNAVDMIFRQILTPPQKGNLQS
jgi:TetR/AcrR family transcriptional repressor of nem operon